MGVAENNGTSAAVLQLLQSIDSRMSRIEHKLDQSSREFVPRELFNNLVAEVEDLAERVDSLQTADNKNSGRSEIIGRLVWPIVTALTVAFAAWLGLGKDKL